MIQYSIYKGMGKNSNFGAIQFNLKKAEEEREGVIFVNACSSTGVNIYDWENKFTFALGIADLGKILAFFVTAGENGQLSLVHDPNMKKEGAGEIIKSMNFFTKEGCLNGCLITTTTKKGSDVVSHKIPVSGD